MVNTSDQDNRSASQRRFLAFVMHRCVNRQTGLKIRAV